MCCHAPDLNAQGGDNTVCVHYKISALAIEAIRLWLHTPVIERFTVDTAQHQNGHIDKTNIIGSIEMSYRILKCRGNHGR